jgi:hypothetical protein
MGRKRFANDITTSRKMLEDIGGTPVDTYKAPMWSFKPGCDWAYDVLVECGYRIDHSAMPAYKRYLGIDPAEVLPRKMKSGLIMIPPTVRKTFAGVIPICGGFYNAYLPFSLLVRCYSELNEQGIPFNFYFHPFEYSPGAKSRRFMKSSVQLSLYSAHVGKYKHLLSQVSSKFALAPLREAYSELIKAL